MHSTIGISIEASPAMVFAIVRDVTRWDRLLPHYSRSRAELRHDDGSVTCSFVARRPILGLLGLGLPVAWRSRVSTDPEHRRLLFRHIGGATAGMEVTWRIEPRAGGGTRVDIDHDFDRGPAGLLPTLVDRYFTRTIAGRTLETFRAIAEAVVAEGIAP